MEESKAQEQFINIALRLTPALIRNRNVQTPEEAVQLYVQVYDAVVKAATTQSPGEAAPETASS